MPKFTKPRGLQIDPNCYYSIAKVAKYFDVSEESVRRAIKKNEFTNTIRFGNDYKIKGSGIIEYENQAQVA